MASHVPFLAIRPDDQFSTEITKANDPASPIRDLASASSHDPMDSPPRLTRPPATAAQVSRIPGYVRFPLICVLSFALSTLLYSFASDFSGYQFATASRHLEKEWQVAALLGWKVVELGVAWGGGYDCTYLLSGRRRWW